MELVKFFSPKMVEKVLTYIKENGNIENFSYNHPVVLQSAIYYHLNLLFDRCLPITYVEGLLKEMDANGQIYFAHSKHNEPVYCGIRLEFEKAKLNGE